MKTFHSSGTPIGIADRIPKWKQSITNAAMAVGQPPWENSSASGTNISMAVLKCAMNRDTGPGRRSSGNFSKNLRFSHLVRISGLFDIIVEITKGKCLFSFDVAAPIQIATHTSLHGDDQVDPEAGEQERHGERPVHLAAGGQEDHLVAQTRHREQRENRRRSATSAAHRYRCRARESAPFRRRTSAMRSTTSSAP